MKVLISSWGNFKEWSEVKYEILIGEREYSCVSKTPLLLLQKVIHPDKTIVFVLDTLYEIFGGKGDRTYNEITDFVKKETLDRLKTYGIEAEVFVLPGVWSGENVSFTGTMRDFYYMALKFLAEELNDPDDDELEIYLDITHGINFASVFIYEALKRLGAVLALLKNVKFVVYNSEPYTKAVSSLRVHEIEKGSIDPGFYYTPLSEPKEKLFAPYFGLPNEDKSEIGKYINSEFGSMIKSIAREFDAFAASVINLFPLGIFTFYPDSEKLNDILEESTRFYEENVVVKDGKVQRKVGFGKKYESIVFLKTVVNLLNRIEVKRCIEIRIGRLYELVKSLERIGKAQYQIASNEISNIKKKLKDTQIESWTSLAQLDTPSEREITTYKDSSRNERIFIAHAGLEKTSVEIHPSGLIRYVGEKLETVKNTIINTL